MFVLIIKLNVYKYHLRFNQSLTYLKVSAEQHFVLARSSLVLEWGVLFVSIVPSSYLIHVFI